MLEDLTRQLQIISQNADIHTGNANVAHITAEAIRDAQTRFHTANSSALTTFQRIGDAIDHVIACMRKQHMRFLNHKSRKDSIMTLVYNLVTQQNAANNFQIAADMKRDSTSMNPIAALTTAFLPVTFTATVLGAGIFSAIAGSQDIHVSGVWWQWIAITLPLTAVVVACWWYYKRRKLVRSSVRARGSVEEPVVERKERPKPE
jgi:hypothetical protein